MTKGTAAANAPVVRATDAGLPKANRRATIAWSVVLALAVLGGVILVARHKPADDRAQYYGVKTLLRGGSPYTHAGLTATWRADGCPVGIRAGGTGMWYANAPNLALVLWPAAVLPPRWGLRCIVLLNLVASIAGALLLVAAARVPWPTWLKCAFVTFAVLSGYSTLNAGQITCVMMAAVAGAFSCSRRGRHVQAGLWLSIALAKPTLDLLHPLWLAIRRSRVIAAVAVAAFVLSCTAILLPGNLVHSVASAAHLYPKLGTGPNDPANIRNTAQTNIRQAWYVVLGPNRRIVEPLNAICTVCVLTAVFAFLVGRRRRSAPVADGLELGAVTLTNLVLMYNRYYSVGMMPLAAFGLIEAGLAPAGRSLPAWRVTSALVLALSFGPSLASHCGLSDRVPLPALTIALCASYWWLVVCQQRAVRDPVAADTAPEGPLTA